MSRPFDKPITIQKIDKSTEKWSDVFHLHARVNKAKADNQYLTAGATRVDKLIYDRLNALKVILDSGELVGAIIDPLDEAMNSRYGEVARGW